MKGIYALAASTALLVGAWVYLSIGYPDLKITTWIGLVSTAALFFTGGDSEGARKSLGTGIAGILLSALAVYVLQVTGGGLLTTVVALSILAFVLVAISGIPGLSATPATFLGACVFFAAGAKPDESVIFMVLSWVLGLLLGYCIGALGKRFGTLVGA